ncbi:MAG: DUF423 domain-containing protein [candidate division KSB1 bacterium]|nr:DUF423 domain-containing protein [candidate division KSB1 bacterium]MDZ7273454.1 DUF423 domain-containing protein [candidate division KSB1 bacterium]MDZ7286954.1 DUF423 domain-containing protein [candidate division KSB1 bacterium]MDZ7299693.1 DUF423 domain-containing protein [candidate division KSB1 bacterium]MDZ7308709.1 DUF423 domain-containing protein [candidate division KSB1 bacterium]
MAKLWLVLAALSGFLSVALGAFGAHALKATLDVDGREIYEKAVQYQMFHTTALLLLGLLQSHYPALPLQPAGWGFVLGMLLFSGSLYLLAVTGMKWLAAITPFGGLAFLFGWLWLVYAVWKNH